MNDNISRRILSLVAAGMDVTEATKQVVGAENYERMIGELYEGLRAS